MDRRYEIRLAGEGGQGMILAGLILAEAAAIYEGKNASQSQSYSAEARGGDSTSEVIISDGEIIYPKVTDADLLLCMSQEACDRYAHELKENGILIVDSVNVTRVPTGRAYRVPITKIAEEATKRRGTANMVGLGLVIGLTGVVSREAIQAAVSARSPKGTEEMNLKALAAGLETAEELKRTS
jgi:2-oxoglutarate ferredoxin oxidoreductase subunit gamma